MRCSDGPEGMRGRGWGVCLVLTFPKFPSLCLPSRPGGKVQR